MSDEVALRPVREDDLPMLEELTQDPEKTGEFEWFGWSDLRHWRQGWDENGLKAGFTREGITRATGWRDGAWRDGVIYSLLRTDPAV